MFGLQYLDETIWQSTSNKLVGCTFKNTQGKEFTVTKAFYNTEKKSYKFEIIFTESGYKRITSRSDIKKGLVRDRLSGCVSGVGYLGYASVYDNEKVYRIWTNIIGRCYDKNNTSYERYGAKGVTVCIRWHNFDNFLEDFTAIEGYDEEKFQNGELELDKDIKQQNIKNKIYSKETCIFVSRKINDIYRDNSTRKTVKFKAKFNDDEWKHYSSIREFCKANNLNNASVSLAIREKRNHKGWTFERNDN